MQVECEKWFNKYHVVTPKRFLTRVQRFVKVTFKDFNAENPCSTSISSVAMKRPLTANAAKTRCQKVLPDVLGN